MTTAHVEIMLDARFFAARNPGTLSHLRRAHEQLNPSGDRRGSDGSEDET